jgi:hypothetical protein
MIIKIYNYKIKHQLNTKKILDHDNLIKCEKKTNYETKFTVNPVSKDEKKTNLKKLILSDPLTKSTSQIYQWNL